MKSKPDSSQSRNTHYLTKDSTGFSTASIQKSSKHVFGKNEQLQNSSQRQKKLEAPIDNRRSFSSSFLRSTLETDKTNPISIYNCQQSASKKSKERAIKQKHKEKEELVLDFEKAIEEEEIEEIRLRKSIAKYEKEFILYSKPHRYLEELKVQIKEIKQKIKTERIETDTLEQIIKKQPSPIKTYSSKRTKKIKFISDPIVNKT